MIGDAVSGPSHPTVRPVRCQFMEIFLSAIVLPALSSARAVTDPGETFSNPNCQVLGLVLWPEIRCTAGPEGGALR